MHEGDYLGDAEWYLDNADRYTIAVWHIQPSHVARLERAGGLHGAVLKRADGAPGPCLPGAVRTLALDTRQWTAELVCRIKR